MEPPRRTEAGKKSVRGRAVFGPGTMGRKLELARANGRYRLDALAAASEPKPAEHFVTSLASTSGDTRVSLQLD